MRRHKARAMRRAISLTPLIDVIFLLLLFFMLSSTFTRFADVPLVVAGGQQAPTDQPDRIQVFVRLGPDGATVNGAPTDLADIPLSVQQVAGDAPLQILLSVAPKTASQLLVVALAQSRSINNAQIVVLR